MMNDDLAAEAATWVPPWQRPASPPDRGGTEVGEDHGISREAAAERAESDRPADGPENGPGAAGEPVSRLSSNLETGLVAGGGSEVAPDDPGALADPVVPQEQEQVAAASDQPAAADGHCGQSEGGQVDAWPGDGGEDEQGYDEQEAGGSVGSAGTEPVIGPGMSGEAGEGEAETGAPAPADDLLPRQWAGLAGAQWRTQGHEAAAATESAASVVDTLAAQVETPQPRAPEAEVTPGSLPETELAAPLPGLAEGELVPALEAILLVVDEPVSEITLAQVLDVTAEQVANALIDLSAAYTRDGRGFDLRRAAGGWRFYTRADYSTYVERFVLDGQQLRLTQASLETLAVVAYKQPVTRSRISAIRGVNCDGVIRTLVTRGMIEECGTDPDSGAHLYRTTILFLEKLGLDSVEQLPPLAPFLPDNLDEVANG